VSARIFASRLSIAATLAGCLSSSSSPYECSGPTSYQAFQPYTATSAIPLCTDGTDAGAPIPYDSGSPYRNTYMSFAGASPLSAAGFSQCAVICAAATQPVPCCRSQWLPQTVLCEPACQ